MRPCYLLHVVTLSFLSSAVFGEMPGTVTAVVTSVPPLQTASQPLQPTEAQKPPTPCPYDYEAAIEALIGTRFIPYQGPNCPEPAPEPNSEWVGDGCAGHSMAQKGFTIPILSTNELNERCECEILFKVSLGVWMANHDLDASGPCHTMWGDSVSVEGTGQWITSHSDGTAAPLVYAGMTDVYGVLNSHTGFTLDWTEHHNGLNRCGAVAIITDIQYVDARLNESCPERTACTPVSDPGWHFKKLLVGSVNFGKDQSTVSVIQRAPSLDLFSPKNLAAQGGEIIHDAHGIRQVKTDTALLDVFVVSEFEYDLAIYPAANVGAKSDGLYQFSGSPVAVYTVSNPHASTNILTELMIVEQRDQNVITNQYLWVPGNQAWTANLANGVQTERQTSYLTNYNTVQVDVFETFNTNDNKVVSKVIRKFQLFDWGKVLIEEVENAGATNPLVTTHSYWTNATDLGFKRVKQTVFASGDWRSYEYDSSKRVRREFSPFESESPTFDSNLCRVVVYDYGLLSGAGDVGGHTNDARTTLTYVLGQEVGRSYLVHLTDGRKEIACQWPGDAWNSASNLVTITKYCTNGFANGLISSVLSPDGVLETRAYATNTTQKITTTCRGQPNAGLTNVVDGRRTITVVGTHGQMISNIVQDIATQATLERATYSDYDDQFRPRQVTYLDGTFTRTEYACCGTESETDRDGVVTSFGYDDLHRKTTETRLGITTIYDYDARGNLERVSRQGTNASMMILRTMGYDLAGRLIAETNALQGATTYAEFPNGSGERVKLTTYPDLGTRIETYARAGHLRSVTGTAVRPVRYQTGLVLDSGFWRIVRREIKLDANGADTSEWTESYTDMLGREYKTVYAAASAPFPAAQSFFNSKGQLWKRVDPDGVTTLHQYNLRGELEYTCLDMNRNGVIDFAGSDLITRSVSDVISNYGTTVLRTRTYAWNTNGVDSATLISTLESSADGRRTWSTSAGLVTRTETAFLTNGVRRLSVFAPDGAWVETDYENGRLTAVTARDSTGAQVTRTTYGYDSHGRQNTTTDARKGATSYTFNDADLPETATTPVPGPGLKAQTTTTLYDPSLRPWKTVYADGGSVTNEFYPTGDPKKKSGARTYPVEYTYDPQGRLKTLKTWQDFAGNGGTAVTTWNYGLYRGFLTSKRFADFYGPTYTYTAAERVETRAWARGITSTNAYNNAGEIESVTYSGGATPAVTYTYDRRGRLLNVIRNGITTSFAYNEADQVTSESYAGGTLNGFTLTRGYDAYRRQNSLLLNTSPALSHGLGYDDASRLDQVWDGAYAAEYDYLANSMLVRQIAFKQSGVPRMTATKEYDMVDRLTSIATAPSSSAPWRFGYDYNDSEAAGSGTLYQRLRCDWADGSFWFYSYDRLGQVAGGRRYWSENELVSGQQFEYGYDDIGNRKVARWGGNDLGQPMQEAAYVPNSLNQYSSRSGSFGVDLVGVMSAAALPAGLCDNLFRQGEYFHSARPLGAAYGPFYNLMVISDGQGNTASGYFYCPRSPEGFYYDLDGNLTFDGRWIYTWDGENRLVSIESLESGPAASKRRQEFEYDYLGRCIRKKTYRWNSSYAVYSLATDTKYVYDGWRVIAELNASNGLMRSYLWGLDLSGSREGAGGVGGLVKMTVHSPTTSHHFYAYDGNGNVVGLTDAATGVSSAKYEYGPFGEMIRLTGTMGWTNAFRWSTKLTDDDSDFVYYGRRYYNPSTGRWLSRDPIEEKGGLNLYAAFNNNPPNLIDVRGLWGADIHNTATRAWAVRAGYPSTAAASMGQADEAVDGLNGGTSPFPGVGDQSYHFNRTRGGGTDSRFLHFAEHRSRAQNACDIANRNDDPETAARELGISLHPLQDWVAHGDYGIQMWPTIYVTHNYFSPQSKFGPSQGYPDDPSLDAVNGPSGRPAGPAMHVINNAGMDYAIYRRGSQRLQLTRTITHNALMDFRNYVAGHGGCACKLYFGVK